MNDGPGTSQGLIVRTSCCQIRDHNKAKHRQILLDGDNRLDPCDLRLLSEHCLDPMACREGFSQHAEADVARDAIDLSVSSTRA